MSSELDPDLAALEPAVNCRLCGEVIGAYEPLVVCENSHMRITSHAAEPSLRTAGHACYHRSCFTGLDGAAV